MSAEHRAPVGSHDDTDTDDVESLRRQLERAQRRFERERAARLSTEKIAEQALTRLYESNESKANFLASISHELRTPLTAIVGFSSLLLQSGDSFDAATSTDFLERIDRNSRILHDMIEEILEFTRLDTQTLEARIRADDVDVAVTTAVDRHRSLLPEHEIELVVEPVRAAIDRDAVSRVLRNLLKNAAKYAPGGSPVRVEVRAEREHAVLRIVDEGPGIPDEEKVLVFEPFYRGRQAHVIAVRGSGIGLTVCRRFVEMMHGSISVEDSVPHGTTIAISLPRTR